MSTTYIHRSDFEYALKSHTGCQTFSEKLEAVQNPDDLLRILGQYIYFNSPFGGGVANLAGEIAVRQDIFYDIEELIPAFADRSGEVAAKVFAAAVDEFGDRSTKYGDIHRTLAQATLKSAGEFFVYSAPALSKLLQPSEATRRAVDQVKAGYGIGKALNDQALFQAIGFHAGSELLADEEFRILNGYLRSAYPSLVTHLENSSVEIAGRKRQAFTWIKIHTSVEADHFTYAAKGAEYAVKYYHGVSGRSCAKTWIIDGINEFADLQATYMQAIVE